MNLKKIVLASAAVIAMSAPAYAADPSASAVWRGYVSGSTAGDELVITGLGGGKIAMGAIDINNDGTFNTITSVIMESRDNKDPDTGVSGTVDNPKIGDLREATWTLANVNVLFDGANSRAVEATVEVYAGDTKLTQDTPMDSPTSSVNLSVSNSTPVPGLQMGAGAQGQIQVTMVASLGA